jgi:AAA+ superfamily predicted ATPase
MRMSNLGEALSQMSGMSQTVSFSTASVVESNFKVGDLVTAKSAARHPKTPPGTTWKVVRLRTREGRIDVTGAKGTVTVRTEDFELHTVAAEVKTGVSFDSVILEDEKKQQIVDAISQIDHHDTIFNKWGFSEVFEKGTAISLLFYGPPGTGKTLMAQAIADKYRYELKLISTAEIETPEPGGAERNLKKYFAEAQDGKTVLLFDECDSLITDRQRVGMILAAQINCLLSELERFKGIAIFTTNRLGALDPAFERRLSLKLEFAMPDAEHRAKIWQRMFPKKAPLGKVDWNRLAEIEIAGGHIKNVVLTAARKAASKGHDQITEAVIWEALEHEIAGLESYREALDAYNPWVGTPLQGFKRERGKVQNG